MMRLTRTGTFSPALLLWLTLMAGCGDTPPQVPIRPTPPPLPTQFTLSGVGILAEKEGYRSAFLFLGRPSSSITLDVELIRQ